MKKKKIIFLIPMKWRERNAIWSCLDFLSFLNEPYFSRLNRNSINQITKQFISAQESDEVDIKLNPAQYSICLDALNAAVQYLDGFDSLFVDLDDPNALRLIAEIKESEVMIRYMRSAVIADIASYPPEQCVFPPPLIP